MEHAARRVTDVVAVESSGGHLVEQRLEGVVVALVDDRDLDVAARQTLRRRKTPEACAHDHHSVPRLVVRRSRHGCHRLCEQIHK